jgi:hypothetical protein
MKWDYKTGGIKGPWTMASSGSAMKGIAFKGRQKKQSCFLCLPE